MKIKIKFTRASLFSKFQVTGSWFKSKIFIYKEREKKGNISINESSYKK